VFSPASFPVRVSISLRVFLFFLLLIFVPLAIGLLFFLFLLGAGGIVLLVDEGIPGWGKAARGRSGRDRRRQCGRLRFRRGFRLFGWGLRFRGRRRGLFMFFPGGIRRVESLLDLLYPLGRCWAAGRRWGG
jgi:hypothetical protein